MLVFQGFVLLLNEWQSPVGVASIIEGAPSRNLVVELLYQLGEITVYITRFQPFNTERG